MLDKLNAQLSQAHAHIEKAKIFITAQKQSHNDEKETLNGTIAKLQEQHTQLNSKYNQLIHTNNAQKENHKNIVDNISNSQKFIISKDYSQIIEWFAKKSIKVDIDHDKMDTQGFFDEVAIALGNNFATLDSVLEQIRYVQRKGYDRVKITLDNKNNEEIATIKHFCQEIYDYSFASKYFHDTKKNAIYLDIQKATKIINFFNGMWMEWYVYMMLLDLFDKLDITSTMVRGLEVNYLNNEKNELDIFFIANEIPVCIECKSGEFRQDIDKYLKLKKRLKLSKEQFIMCVIGADDILTDGMTNTYDITFTNQSNLSQYIKKLLFGTQVTQMKKPSDITFTNQSSLSQNTKKLPYEEQATQAKKPSFFKSLISSLDK